MSSTALTLGFVALVGAFFKTQVIQYKQYVMQSEENRLRPIPLPAPRGIIYDRHGQVLAENLPAYSVSITAPSVDSLRSALAQLAPTLQLGQSDINNAIRRYRRAPTRPTVILPDATIDIVSVLEEHRLDFPRLIIQSVPKRYYPDGPSVASFVGYTGEITESDLNDPKYASYKPGQQIGKAGLEKQYEAILHGKEGVRFDEVDAHAFLAMEYRLVLLLEAGFADLLSGFVARILRIVEIRFGDFTRVADERCDARSVGVVALRNRLDDKAREIQPMLLENRHDVDGCVG